MAAAEHADSALALQAERTVTRALAGGCTVPVAAHAVRIGDGQWRLIAYADRDGMISLEQADGTDPRGARRRGARSHVTVYLVGAGPGDPGLITVRGLELVRSADVLVYDRLAAPELVAEAPAACERIYAGKGPASHAMSQDEINACLVEQGGTGRARRAPEGRRPVRVRPRLRGGRGAARGGRRLRGGAGHHVGRRRAGLRRHPGHPPRPRDALHGRHGARGSGQGPRRRRLGGAGARRRHARDPDGRRRPARHRRAADRRRPRRPTRRRPSIARGTTPRQHAVTGTLATIADAAADVRPPAITVVGSVAGLREGIAWAERRPLHGVTVAVTRARTQASRPRAPPARPGRRRDRGAR